MFAQNTAPRRVVVTGMGIACPLGVGVAHVWRRLTAGESGISAIQSFDTNDLPAKIAAERGNRLLLAVHVALSSQWISSAQ